MRKSVYFSESNNGYMWCEGKVQFTEVHQLEFHHAGKDCNGNDCEETLFLDACVGGVERNVMFNYSENDKYALYRTEEDAVNHANAYPRKAYEVSNLRERCEFELPDELYISKDGMSLTTIKGGYDLTIHVDLTGKMPSVMMLGGHEYTFFDDKEMLKQCTDVTVVEADGSTHIHKCLESKLALTPEQKAATEALASAYNACKELGVKFLHITDYGKLYACNGEYAKYLRAENYGEDNEVNVKGIITEVSDSIDLNHWSEEYNICAVLKTNED